MGYGSQADRELSWYLKGPLKACEMALRLKTHTAEAAMLFLGAEEEKGEGRSESPAVIPVPGPSHGPWVPRKHLLGEDSPLVS